MSNNKEINIEKFKIWYKQNGTPLVKFKRKWNSKKQTLTIQACQVNKNKKSLY